MISLVGQVLAPEDLGVGVVTVADGRIVDMAPADSAPTGALGAPDAWIVPGLIDIQLNGAFGVDFSDPGADLGHAARALPATGVTAFLPTIVSSMPEVYGPAIANLHRAPDDGEARVLGVHLEGPFIAASRRGAHDPDALRAPDIEELRAWLATGDVRIVTLAPELPGALPLVEAVVSSGAIASIGHSDATWEDADAAVRAGARLGTHVFNAMRPFHHREPGIAGRLLEPGAAASVIVDGFHLAPGALRVIASAKAPDELIVITDGIAALGRPAGRYRLGDREVVSDGASARLADGTLAGAVMPMARAIGQLVADGFDPSLAVRAASTNPARLLGLEPELGRLAVGRRADLVLLDADWVPQLTLAGGHVAHDVRRS